MWREDWVDVWLKVCGDVCMRVHICSSTLFIWKEKGITHTHMGWACQDKPSHLGCVDRFQGLCLVRPHDYSSFTRRAGRTLSSENQLISLIWLARSDNLVHPGERSRLVYLCTQSTILSASSDWTNVIFPLFIPASPPDLFI